MADRMMNQFPIVDNASYVYVELADGTQGKIKKSDLIHEKSFFMEINKEIDLGFNISALLCIKSPQITGMLAVVLAINNSIYFTEVSNTNTVYSFEKDVPNKVCIYKTEPFGNIKIKNLTNTDSSLIISIV